MSDDVTSPVESGRLEAGSEPPPHASPSGPENAEALLDERARVPQIGDLPALDVKNGSEQSASRQRETSAPLSATERLLAATLEELKETKVALRQSDAARTVITDRLRLQTARGRRLTTRVALLGSELRTKTADAAEARRDRAATLAETHHQIRALTSVIGTLEARLVAGHGTKVDGLSAPVSLPPDAEAALFEAQRLTEHVRSEHERSRWIKIGRVLKLTKL